jgi:tRNA U34 2-thiouridine synthase MnmA/TrmU
MGTDHPALYCNEFAVSKPHWLCKDFESDADDHQKPSILDSNIEFKYQHKHKQSKIEFLKKIKTGDGYKYILRTSLSMRAVTPGQFVVFYDNDECIGSSRIVNVQGSHSILNVNGDIVNSDKLLSKKYQ